MSENRKTAINLLILALGMFVSAFAAFPLYNIFCKVTGYAGTPNVSKEKSIATGNKTITVRFNADIEKSMNWKFYPLQDKITGVTGENELAFFVATNLSSAPITGVASFNIAPDQAGKYFHKVQCFCFNKQTLKPGETAQMPVSFYVDPKIEEDPDLKDTKTITLSYTFFKVVD